MIKKTFRIIYLLTILSIFLCSCKSNNISEVINKEQFNEDVTREVNEDKYAIEFIDDMGNTIKLKEPCKRIISLYSAHTENLFSLGLNEEIIGVGTSDIFPTEVFEKEVFDYKSDPEKIIVANPDVVIIRPFINRKVPEFVEAIENVGITVVSLYPESFDVFDDYILKLGLITGKAEEAQNRLDDFYKEIDSIASITNEYTDKKSVFFESTETNLRTITPDSMAGRAIEFAGGINIASDAKPTKEGSSIAEFGIEKILENANEIDLYISQRGAMNSGGNEHSIGIRPGYDTIKAVKEDNILLINEKIISSPNFRYSLGIKEISRMLYPEEFNNIYDYSSDDKITRSDLAKIIIKYLNKPIYVPTSSYYRSEHKGHTYGMFEDVKYTDQDFYYIETAVTSGYLSGYKEDELEYFYPDNLVTKDELSKIIFLIGDYSSKDIHKEIKDLKDANNYKIIQKLVDNGVFELDDGFFYPNKELTVNDVIGILEKL